MNILRFLPLLFLVIFSNCKEDETPPVVPVQENGSLTLSSPVKVDFRLDDTYSCVGDNVSPLIFWTSSLTTAKSYAVVMSNGLEGAGREVYHLLFDIPLDTKQMDSGEVPVGAIEGANSSGSNGYSGPCPEMGTGKQPFVIELYAINKTLDLAAGSSEQQFMDAISGAVVKMEEITTYYSSFSVSSSNFAAGEKIPVLHTCDGDHSSPQIQWENGNSNAVAYALHFFDKDALGYIHWLVTDFEGNAIPEGVVPTGAVQGKNSRDLDSYFGPCPGGESHVYFFRLYALDQKTGLERGYSLEVFENAIEGHIVDQTDFFAVYN